MSKVIQRAPKAYKNADFLNSPDARAIRIISEFLEPLRRFRYQGVRDTIVFFGSARTKPMREVAAARRAIERRVRNSKKGATSLRQKLRKAEIAEKMSAYYEDAVELSRRLTRWSKHLYQENRFVVCSGGGPGIMEAANRGASLAGGKSIGLNISLPFEQSPNRYISKEFNFEFHYFFMRKFWFVYLAKAFVMFPGGYGTLDEMMEVLTLLQTNKIKKKVTLVLYGREYWEKVLSFEEMVNHGVIHRRDLRLFTFADSPKEAYDHLVRELTKNYPRETAAG
ncbi:MAG: TIGR00730 family Rossman fold protein [Ignavibacteriales bacterium]|nr:TIGR00730 family Rossman fold protein [Ignavibacteriales bacterium]